MRARTSILKMWGALLIAGVVGISVPVAHGQAAPAGDLPTNVPRNGLVAFWSADGHAKDSVAKHHGTVQGNVKYTTGRHGKAKGAFGFDGKSGSVKIPDKPELDTDFAFTLSAWVNPTAYTDRKGLSGWITCKYYTGAPGPGSHADYALSVTKGGCLQLMVAEDAAKIGKYHYLSSRAVVPRNTWTHVAATFDRGVIKLYINGELAASMVSTTVKRTAPNEYPHDDVHIGALWNNSYIFTGAIDEVGIWNRALSDDEVAAIAGVATEPPPAYLPRKDLVAFWSADGHARDSAGKNHAIVGNGVGFAADRHAAPKGAFLFSGDKGVVTIPDSAALDTDDAFTLSAWVNPAKYETTKGQNCSMIMAKWSGDAKLGNDYILRLWEDGRPLLKVANRAAGFQSGGLGATAVVPLNAWTHIAATFDRGQMKIYINGQLSGEAKTKIKHTDRGEYAHDEVTVGGFWPGNSYRFHGAIDDVGIWKRALTPDEIAAVAGPMAGMYVVRLAGVDRVEMNDSSVLRGTIQNKQFTVATPFGKLVIPVGKVVGILPAPKPKAATARPGSPQATQPASQPAAKGPWVHLLLTYQVVTGRLDEPIIFQTSWSPRLTVPVGSLRQCSYRTVRTKPMKAAATGTTITLRSYQRLMLADKNVAIQFQTDWGKVALPIKTILRIESADWQSTRHKAYFANGSVLTGTLPQKLKLKLALGPELTVGPGQVWGVTGTAKPVKPAGATMVLRGGDRLIGRLAGKMLTVKTASGDVKVHASGIASMQFDANKPTGVTVRSWDNKTIKGTVTDAVVAMEIVPGGPTLKIPTPRIANVTQPGASPPPEMLEKIEKLIAQLGAESYVDREKAQKALVKMGKSIVPILKKHLNNRDPEIRQRLEQIIKALGG